MRLTLLLLTVLLLLAAAPAEGWPPASPLLPPDHWAVRAAERLHEVGLAPDWLPAQRAAPLRVVGTALSEAAARAAREAPRWAPLARAWAARFAAEFPRALAADGVRLAGAEVGAGAQLGHVAEPKPAAPQPGFVALTAPADAAMAEASAAALLGEHLAAGARLQVDTSDVAFPAAELVGALGPWALSVGRGPVGYGPNELGAVVTSGAVPLDRVELMTTAPLRLPGPLEVLGDFALDTALARFDEARHPYDPLLWTFQLQWRPHPRLTLAASRGLMFGGKNWEGIPTKNVPLSLLGIKNFNENNVYSGSVQVRLPTEAWLPLTAKVEWGSDDNPGALVQWPGLVAGLSAPMLGSLPAALGVEYAYFGKGPFGYHTPFGWYAHGQYTGGWVTGQTPLGDPLGGNGRALRLLGAADLWDARIRLTGAGWVQERSPDNLYAPSAAGRSVGGRGEAELRQDRWAVALRGGYERGEQGWSRGELTAMARFFL
ncbi:capsule assembly Wzi family protein [Anaeromyxobacter diazotrophicus]|uniref:Capsule assembly protein Wzi n=1 Tax=Anaeromyxobacter diazotrophicus TaxID=2590199 RepID=A0A7I9VGC5_9BACT|nr:capsule assembly Wzi family protein [Anaeromyxobacter diazotrophicus]GEJ55446.1 hypothetical protein AMYX_01870 [Anaeromyxobacter diazotrophicus]